MLLAVTGVACAAETTSEEEENGLAIQSDFPARPPAPPSNFDDESIAKLLGLPPPARKHQAPLELFRQFARDDTDSDLEIEVLPPPVAYRADGSIRLFVALRNRSAVRPRHVLLPNFNHTYPASDELFFLVRGRSSDGSWHDLPSVPVEYSCRNGGTSWYDAATVLQPLGEAHSDHVLSGFDIRDQDAIEVRAFLDHEANPELRSLFQQEARWLAATAASETYHLTSPPVRFALARPLRVHIALKSNAVPKDGEPLAPFAQIMLENASNDPFDLSELRRSHVGLEWQGRDSNAPGLIDGSIAIAAEVGEDRASEDWLAPGEMRALFADNARARIDSPLPGTMLRVRAFMHVKGRGNDGEEYFSPASPWMPMPRSLH